MGYLYDLGDSWQHTLDDSGGKWSYAELVEILADPKRADPEGVRGWVDPEFDPEFFDVETVNARLAEPDVW